MAAHGQNYYFCIKMRRFLKKIKPIADELGAELLIECDVSSDESIDRAFKEIGSKWENIDGLVHSIGFAPSDQLEGRFYRGNNAGGF